MAIELINMPGTASNDMPGPLTPPEEFDKKKFAAKWVKSGPAVAAAKEREWIPGTKLTADGWEVWKDSEGKPYEVSLQSGKYVLLHRDITVQKAVNAICGNVGKERLLQEKRGETTGGVPVADPGMLSDETLAKKIGREDLGEEGKVIMNPVPNVERSRVKTPVAETSSRRKVQRRSAE